MLSFSASFSYTLNIFFLNVSTHKFRYNTRGFANEIRTYLFWNKFSFWKHPKSFSIFLWRRAYHICPYLTKLVLLLSQITLGRRMSTKKSCKIKQTYSFQLQINLSMADFLVDTRGLKIIVSEMFIFKKFLFNEVFAKYISLKLEILNDTSKSV